MYLIKQANMLKCTLEPGDRLSETQLMEITSGGHSSLLPCQRAQINGVMTLVYDTHAYNTMESSAAHMTPQQMRQTILELLHALRQMERQSELSGLRMGNLCVEFDKVYLNGETLRPAFVYVPLETAREFPETELRHEIMETIQSNACVRDEGNEMLLRYLQDPGNGLYDLIDRIPKIEQEGIPSGARTGAWGSLSPASGGKPPAAAENAAVRRSGSAADRDRGAAGTVQPGG